jgi:hypothetical protein
MTAAVACTRCKMPLPEFVVNRGEFVPCPECAALLRVEVFPALFRAQVQGQEAEALLDEAESSCFYHPAKRAVVPCEACGRFLCALCDVELRGQHLCPSCLEIGKSKGKLKTLQNNRVLYDNAALALALLPILIFWTTLITAPVALFVALRYWKAPSSLLPRTKIRFIFAIVIAIVQMLVWAGVIYYFLRN